MYRIASTVAISMVCSISSSIFINQIIPKPQAIPLPTHNIFNVQELKTSKKAFAYHKIKSSKEDREDLIDYIELQMKAVGFNKPILEKNTLIKQIVDVANSVFKGQARKKQFVTMIGIESAFNSEALSPVGATGLTQVMPQYAADFANHCSYIDIDLEDIELPEVNLMLGACRFNYLLNQYNEDIELALIGYNAGENSRQMKQALKGEKISNDETHNYILAFNSLKNKADNKLENRIFTKEIEKVEKKEEKEDEITEYDFSSENQDSDFEDNEEENEDESEFN